MIAGSQKTNVIFNTKCLYSPCCIYELGVGDRGRDTTDKTQVYSDFLYTNKSSSYYIHVINHTKNMIGQC